MLGLSQNLFFELAATGAGHGGVSVLIPGLTRTRIFESARNKPATLTAAPPSSFACSSVAAISQAWDDAMPPEQVADVVLEAIRSQRFYVLPCPEEAFDMAGQQLRWMRENVPLVPGPGVARTATGRLPHPWAARRVPSIMDLMAASVLPVPMRGQAAWRRTLEVRERFLAAWPDWLPPEDCGVRREILYSWRRSLLSGADTASTDLLRDSRAVPPGRLVRAAGPVLSRLAAEIAGTQAWAFLADREWWRRGIRRSRPPSPPPPRPRR